MKSKHWFTTAYNKFNEAVYGQVSLFLILVLLFAVGCLIMNDSSETTIQKLYGFVRLSSELALWFVIGNLIYGLYSLIKRRKIKDFRMYLIWLTIILIVSLPYIPKLFGHRSTQIGNFYEARTYTEKYIVYMSKAPKTNENRKVYTLSAHISRFEEEVGTDTTTHYITGERDERPVERLCYHINKLYFDNGGYIDFSYTDSYLTILILNEEVEVTDNEGNIYYITLTAQKSS